MIVEKPFGRDSESSAELGRGLSRHLSEEQVTMGCAVPAPLGEGTAWPQLGALALSPPHAACHPVDSGQLQTHRPHRACADLPH